MEYLGRILEGSYKSYDLFALRESPGWEEYIAESDAKEAVSNCWADRGESKCQNRPEVLERFSCTFSLAAMIVVVAPMYCQDKEMLRK